MNNTDPHSNFNENWLKTISIITGVSSMRNNESPYTSVTLLMLLGERSICKLTNQRGNN